jgi:hypothetical protein
MRVREEASRPAMAGPAVAIKTILKVFVALSRQRLLWLFPVFIGLVIVAVLVAFLTAAGPLAPFVYPLF